MQRLREIRITQKKVGAVQLLKKWYMATVLFFQTKHHYELVIHKNLHVAFFFSPWQMATTRNLNAPTPSGYTIAVKQDPNWWAKVVLFTIMPLIWMVNDLFINT